MENNFNRKIMYIKKNPKNNNTKNQRGTILIILLFSMCIGRTLQRNQVVISNQEIFTLTPVLIIKTTVI